MKTFGLFLTLALLGGAGCKSARVTSERDFAPSASVKPTVVHVADFELGASTIKHQEGMLSGGPGPIGRIGDRLSGGTADPVVRARQIVNLMSDSLVKELSRSGLPARRLPPGLPVPSDGWLLRGIFTEVQEGNRVRRALIGFGEGQTDLQVIATIHDLSLGPPKPLYEIATDATSGSAPGAAPTLVLGPYGAAVRFVMAGKDLDKNVKQTATQIAAQTAKRILPAD